MAKVNIGSAQINMLEVVWQGKTYKVPLAGSMKRKDILKLNSEEAVHNMFTQYIPEDVLDDMTLDEYRQLIDAWNAANTNKDDASLGES
jgi:hypothetical protein